jgi:predicted Zn finger-like uncharacterized protein
MRMVCPNCGAQYEVDDRVIPESGRDVQCSACGHAWYQMPQGYSEDEDEAALPDHDDALLPEDDDEGEGSHEDEVAGTDEPTPEGIEPDDAPAPETPPRPEIDDDVRSILREEAEHELSRRATEQVETQPDLGLDSSPSPEDERRRVARERMARMRGLDDDEAVEAEVGEVEAAPEAEPDKTQVRAARRERFPDIEEINSTLDSHGRSGDAAIGMEVRARGNGFGRGFFLVIFIAALLLAVYMLAPKLAETIPAIEPALTAYIEAVNVGRAWLDAAMQGIIAKIEAMVGES